MLRIAIAFLLNRGAQSSSIDVLQSCIINAGLCFGNLRDVSRIVGWWCE